MIRLHNFITGFALVIQDPFEGDAFLYPTWQQHGPPRYCNPDAQLISRDIALQHLFSVISDRRVSVSAARTDNGSSSSASAKLKAVNDREITNCTQSILPNLHTYQKPRQIRRIPTKRKPRNYWHSTSNLRKELTAFWEEYGVPLHEINPGRPPPIPSEYLLNFFRRNDLRGGIAQNGGRENVSHLLGGAKIVPGKWKEAVQIEEVKYLLPFMTSNLEKAPWNDDIQEQRFEGFTGGTTDKRTPTNNDSVSDASICFNRVETPCRAQRLIDMVGESSPDKGDRDALMESGKEFWSKEKAVASLYRYLESYKKYKHRPSVWMPQLAELSHEGYSELFNACSRFRKLPIVSAFSPLSKNDLVDNEGIENLSGLVPFKEWRFFDSQLQLFVELQNYLNLYHNGSEAYFPDPLDVFDNGHEHLFHLIRVHGGKVLLAQKLSMKLHNNEARHENDLNWGPFTLDFAVLLLHFIRSEFLNMSPPLAYPMISMPLERDLLRCGQDNLAALVVTYGGYESVARRLGLAYFDGKSRRMNEVAFKGARYLWKHRNSSEIVTGLNSSIKSLPNQKMKRKGIAWNKHLVVEELHAYVKVNMTKRSLASVWMPRFSQFDDDDRGDLKNAISKCGGMNAVCESAGLIPYSVWSRFESFRELVAELLRFNTNAMQFSAGSDDFNRLFIIPTPTQMAAGNFTRLLELIRLAGGRKIVHNLLLVNGKHELKNLAFLVELTEFIHLDMMSKEPPFSNIITLPTREDLLRENRGDLIAYIHENGYDGIADVMPGVSCDITN